MGTRDLTPLLVMEDKVWNIKFPLFLADYCISGSHSGMYVPETDGSDIANINGKYGGD